MVVVAVTGVVLYRLFGRPQSEAPAPTSATSKYITPSMSYHRTRRQPGPRADSRRANAQSKVRAWLRGRVRVTVRVRARLRGRVRGRARVRGRGRVTVRVRGR